MSVAEKAYNRYIEICDRLDELKNLPLTEENIRERNELNKETTEVILQFLGK